MGIDQSIIEILEVLRALVAAGICFVIAWYFFRVIGRPRAAFPFFAFLAAFGVGGAILRAVVGSGDPGSINLASCDSSTYPNIIICNGWPLYLDVGKSAMELIMGLGGHYGGAVFQSGLMAAVTLLALYKSLAKNIWRGSGWLVLEAFALGCLSWIVMANAGWFLGVLTSAITYGVGQVGESSILLDLSAKLSAYQSAIGMAERVTDFATIGELQTTKQVSGFALLLIHGCMGLFGVMTILNTVVVCVLVLLTNYLPSIALLMIVLGSYSWTGLLRFIAYGAVFKIFLFVEFALLRLLPDAGDNALKLLLEAGGTIMLLVFLGMAIVAAKTVLLLKFVHYIYQREFVPIRSGLRILTGEKI
jgi:hypothetical protein